MRFVFNTLNILAGCVVFVTITACNGILEGIYDKPTAELLTKKGQLRIDASSWTDWYYVDFDSLALIAQSRDTLALAKAQTQFVPYPIPLDSTDVQTVTQTGIYTYWFDVFGQGISKNEKRGFYQTSSQPEPKKWSIAIHRDNVRTNGAAVLETNYTSMDELPKTSSVFMGASFQKDEFTENQVWADQSKMFSMLIGCQGISINRTLSSWLTLEIPPMPPSFKHNNHIFIIRFSDGKCAAVQLENYIGLTGTKCQLTVNYKYPY